MNPKERFTDALALRPCPSGIPRWEEKRLLQRNQLQVKARIQARMKLIQEARSDCKYTNIPCLLS
ncbi:hypothetical protein YC2023_123238 [Brassica napus]